MSIDSETRASLVAEYARGLAAYSTQLAELGIDHQASEHRVEHQFECLRDWSLHHTLEELEQWFLAQRKACGMRVEEIPLAETRGWITDPKTGDLRHESGLFFTVHGLRIQQSSSREVGKGGWDQPILTQVGYDGGLLGILRQRIDGVPHYLIEAKAEPGNYGIVLLSPTLQATFSNLERAHGGRKPWFAEVFEQPQEHGTLLSDRWLSEDGGRLYRKRNRGMMVEVPATTEIELPPSFVWMSMFQIKACLDQDAWVNPHIRGIIAHL